MSYDFQIEHLCPHAVREEFLLVDAVDRRTVRPLRPIASAQSVEVRLNGAIDIPSPGVDATARTVGSREGPFRITPTNGTLRISVDGGPVQTATLPPSERMSSNELAVRLNTQLSGVVFAPQRTFLAMETLLGGDAASVYILGQSPLATLIGLKADREYRGRRIAPGWTLVDDPSTLSDRPTRLIFFDDPLPGFEDFVEVNYVTMREECRRCGGLGVENDWRYGPDGKPIVLRNEDLLLQELNKILMTVRGSNPFFPGYGSSLLERIGQKGSPGAIIQSAISADIQQAFARWQSVKRKQEQEVGQFVSDEEYPFRLLGVGVEQSSRDPTVLFVNVTVQNRSLRQIQLTRGMRIPNALLDAGSSQSLRDLTLR